MAVLGVRYYTVPNGKEGEMLNPGGTALTVGETKVSLGAYNYYYSRIVQNYLNYANYGYYDLDSTKDYSKQYVTNSDGEKITWLQMFKDKTVDQIQYVTSYGGSEEEHQGADGQLKVQRLRGESVPGRLY